MGKLHLAVGIFLAFNVNLDFVTDLEVVVVAEFGSVDDAVGLEADVDNHLAVVDGNHLTSDHIALLERLERLGVNIFQAGLFVLRIAVVLLRDLVPAEVFEGVSVSVLKVAHFAGSFGGFLFGHGSFFGSGHCFFSYGSCGFGNIFHVLCNFFSLFRSIQ